MIGPLEVRRTAIAISTISGDSMMSVIAAIVTFNARTDLPFLGRARRSRKTGGWTGVPRSGGCSSSRRGPELAPETVVTVAKSDGARPATTRGCTELELRGVLVN